MQPPTAIPADGKDWTFVITDGCAGCADQWQRPGRRGNGSVFTVASFAAYFLHDVDHHVHDVTR